MDRLVKGFAFDGQVRLIGIEATDLVQIALDTHKLSPVGTAALGKLLVAGAIMGSMMKNDKDKLTLIVKGDGPLGNIVVCSDSKAIVKGYVQNPMVDVPLTESGNLDIGTAVGRNGLLTVIKDIGLKEPQAGSVELKSGEIGDELTEYFLISEQIPSVIQLSVSVTKDAKVSCACGYLLQLMPGTDNAIIDMIVGRISNKSPISELLKEGFSIEDILKAISGDDMVTVLDEITPKFLCDCSRERMEQALNTISPDERKKMLEEDGFIEMKCSFCGKVERWN